MRRWHEERDLMLRRWRQELGNHTGGVLDPVKSAGMEWEAPPAMACGIDCHCARGIGTMRKNRPYGCSCWMCKLDKHYDKWGRGGRRRAAIQFDLEAEGG